MSKLYRYAGDLLSWDIKYGVATIRIDQGFDKYKVIELLLSRRSTAAINVTHTLTPIVFDTEKPKNKGLWRGDLVKDEWNRECKYEAKIVDCYDGDSVKAYIDLGFNDYAFCKLRLYGVDTPEIRGEERDEGLVARDWLREQVLNKQVIINTNKDKVGKYGRYLAVIMKEGININDKLLELGLAKPYGLEMKGEGQNE